MEDDEGAWKTANHHQRSYGAQSLVHCYNRACRTVITIVISGVVILHFSLLPSQQASYCSHRSIISTSAASFSSRCRGILNSVRFPYPPLFFISQYVVLSVCLSDIPLNFDLDLEHFAAIRPQLLDLHEARALCCPDFVFQGLLPVAAEGAKRGLHRARSRSRKGSGRICVLVVMSVFFPCLDPRFSCIASEIKCTGFLKILEQYRIIL